MGTSGLSAVRLARLHAVLARHVGRGTLAGAVTLVSRRGEHHVETVGLRDVGSGAPMQRDTIFRIASMTKPIAAVAAMILVEECRLRLDDPINPFLPELANRRVLRRRDSALDDTESAERAITLRDLLTMRMGFGFVMAPPDSLPIQRALQDGDVAPGPPRPKADLTPDAWIARFARLPLMAQPGTAWMYPTAFSVLGVLIARASGQPLETFLRERIFEPLGMRDTSFSVPEEKLGRLAASYQGASASNPLSVYDGIEDSAWRQRAAFQDADGGLVSTVDDYLAFATMLMNGGKHGSQRIISRPSVEVMTTNHLTDSQRAGAEPFLAEYQGWGFGVSVVTRRNSIAATPGRYGWEGGLGTSWANDPAEGLIGILMTQAAGFPDGLYDDFWTSVYQALDD